MRWCWCLGWALGFASLHGCAGEFDTTRKTPARGSLGREMYTLVCDRVGAQSLPEDITGASFHSVCHANENGEFATSVDPSHLPGIEPEPDRTGRIVSIEEQSARREYHTHRIERLAAHREGLIQAFDGIFQDAKIPIKNLANENPTASCTEVSQRSIQLEMADVLSRLTRLYNDGTIPETTRATARVLLDVLVDQDAQTALARVENRKGYRPPALSTSLARPLLSYPHVLDLMNALLRAVASDSDPLAPDAPRDNMGQRVAVPGNAQPAFQRLLTSLHEYQREQKPGPARTTLTESSSIHSVFNLPSRPRETDELVKGILLYEHDSFAATPLPADRRFLAKRDTRGTAAVAQGNVPIPTPFVDADHDGLADMDTLGQFVTSDGIAAPSPFPFLYSRQTTRDEYGRALRADGKPVFETVDISKTYLSELRNNLRTLVEPTKENDVLMKVFAGLPIVFGPRAASPTVREYPADPTLLDDYVRRFGEPPPINLGSTPNKVTYTPFDVNRSPIVAIAHAVGQLVARPEFYDVLQAIRVLLREHPKDFARLVRVGFDVKRIADAHPEAQIPKNSMFWDDLLDIVVRIAQVPKSSGTGRGMIEDIVLAFAQDRTVGLQSTFAAYAEFRDQLTYNRQAIAPASKPDINGPLWNATTGSVAPLKTPVDRSQPDVGDNRSALQRFLQLLHDANGLSICTKDQAIANIRIKWNGIPVSLKYPSDRLIAVPACALVGGTIPPAAMRRCGMIRFDNVAEMIVDVALNRASFDIRDDCLRKLMDSPLTSLVGGVDALLEDASGIKGMSTHPTVAGISRMMYFDTAFQGFIDVPSHSGDPTPDYKQKPKEFLEGVIEPVPTMVCDLTPFKDPSDGKVLPLRRCSNFSDTMRGRDTNALFPVEQNDFMTNIKPLAEAFGNYKPGNALFVELFDKLHVHWGSSQQTPDICDPTLPHDNARWCPGDGAVTYEPLIVDVLRNTDLLASLQRLVSVLLETKVPHCEKFDSTSGLCTKSTLKDGVSILGDAVRALVDPTLNAGLTDHLGNREAKRNDQTTIPQVTPLYLMIDSLKLVDTLFEETSDGEARRKEWRKARSQLVDVLFSTTGQGSETDFSNPSVPEILARLVDLLGSQLLARCPDRTTSTCAWATGLQDGIRDTLKGPVAPAIIELLDAFQQNPDVRAEVGRALTYLLGSLENDAAATTLSTVAELIQSTGDPTIVPSITRGLANVTGTRIFDDHGRVVRTSLADAIAELLSRLTARGHDTSGNRICANEIDPNAALAKFFERLVTPTLSDTRTPLDVFIEALSDVNRADPRSSAKFEGPDYGNVSKELSEFFLDKGRGLEQVYTVVKQATQ